MPTEVDICNMALSRVGASSLISSIDEASKQAELCKLFYTQARDELLETAPWPFANRRQALAELSVTRTGWEFVYALPSDCIAPRYIWAGERALRADQRIPYAIEGDGDATRILLTDQEEAELVYTARIENTGAFPALFSKALSWLLAANLAMPLSVKPELERMALERYRIALGEALSAAFNQEQDDPEPEAEHIAKRA